MGGIFYIDSFLVSGITTLSQQPESLLPFRYSEESIDIIVTTIIVMTIIMGS